MSQEFKQVNKPIRKKDAMNLLLGKPVYVDDVTPHDCLIVKLVHSPHANALIESIDTEAAKAVDTIEAVYTYKDVPQKRFTMAGQTYPGLQKPHCSAPWSAINSASGLAFSCKPSKVVIS